MSTATSAWAHGLATVSTDSATEGSVLDVWFPHPHLGERPADDEAPRELVEATGSDHARRIRREVVTVEIADLAAAPTTTAEVWLRLHLLSHRLVAPHGQSMEGVFGLLTNVVWTSSGPCAVEGFEDTRARMRMHGQHVAVYGIDKFPRMTDYVVPTGVRIADADRVRLGAHLAEGTTVMHEGFVNFNAGTLGALPGRRDELVAHLTRHSPVLADLGCLQYDVGVDDQQPDTVFVVERWTSAQAHRASLEQPEVQASIAEARPLLSGEFGGFRFEVVGSPLGD